MPDRQRYFGYEGYQCLREAFFANIHPARRSRRGPPPGEFPRESEVIVAVHRPDHGVAWLLWCREGRLFECVEVPWTLEGTGGPFVARPVDFASVAARDLADWPGGLLDERALALIEMAARVTPTDTAAVGRPGAP